MENRLIVAFCLLFAFAPAVPAQTKTPPSTPKAGPADTSAKAVGADSAAKSAPAAASQAKATFAAGCFWCLEEAMDKLPGVISTTSGYMGGAKKNPTYEEVSSGTTGHAEVVQIVYDPKKVSYEQLLEQFWINHDPTVTDRQFCDTGSQYRPGIFWHDEEQQKLAEASKAKWEKAKPFRDAIKTPIARAGDFWPAEDYHQDYYQKNPARYRFYATGCGRYNRLDALWGKFRK